MLRVSSRRKGSRSALHCRLTLAIYACIGANRGMLTHINHLEGGAMSKGMNQKKQQKKKPAKSLVEKREVKRAKKLERSSARSI